jgi:hypothetical protein
MQNPVHNVMTTRLIICHPETLVLKGDSRVLDMSGMYRSTMAELRKMT